MASCQRFDGREDCWNDIPSRTRVVLGQISPITALTRVVNKTAYQNSLRRARPLNVAYFEKKLPIAAPNDMRSLLVGVFCPVKVPGKDNHTPAYENNDCADDIREPRQVI